MTAERLQRLTDAGIDVSEALGRFMGNEGLLERFLKKFLDDQNYDALCKAISDGDSEAALTASHTLKGVSGNLSMTELCGLMTEQVKAYRAGAPDEAAAMMPKITEAYQKVVAAIKE